MKKGLAILILVIIAAIVAYTSINWQGNTQNASQANQTVSLKNGGTINLTKEEAALTAAGQQKKIVLTDLGMF